MRQEVSTLILPLVVLLLTPFAVVRSQNMYRLDSIHFDKGIKGTTNFEQKRRVHVLDHDADGRPLTTITYLKGPLGNWALWRRREYTYQAGELSKIRIQYWNPASQSWEDAVERNFEYRPNGDPTSGLVRRAPSPGEPLENQRLWNYQYNNDNQLQQLLIQTWNGSAWENLIRQLWVYQPDGQVQMQMYQNWDGADWRPSRRRIWLYEVNGNALKSVTVEEWNAAMQAWGEVERKIYQNDGQFSWSAIVHQIWADSTQNWDNEDRQMFNFNGPAYLGKEVQHWENNSWAPLYRESLGTTDDTLEVRIEAWDSQMNAWLLDARSQTVYDENRLVLNQGWQYWKQDQSVWSNDSTTQRTRRFWGNFSTRLTGATAMPVVCTTTNPYVIGSPINCSELNFKNRYRMTLYDLSGRTVWEQRFLGSETPSINTFFPPGVYLLSIRDLDSTLVHLQKLIIP